MKENIVNEIGAIIQSFNDSLKLHMPDLEKEVDKLIQEKCHESSIIEHYLDTLLSLSNFGEGENLFIKLLEYYKTIDVEGALFYWNEYDQQN